VRSALFHALNPNLRSARTLLFALTIAAGGAWAQQSKPAAKAGKPPASQARVIIAINEGGAANADAAETLFRFEEVTQLLERELHASLVAVSVRDRNKLKASLKKREYGLLLARPNDVPAEAIRDFGYRPVVVAKEPAQALFIVHKNSPLRTINDVKGKTIVTPDQYSNMWRIANAMLRDAHIDMTRESVKSMRDQAAIGWSMENEFFDVGEIGRAHV